MFLIFYDLIISDLFTGGAEVKVCKQGHDNELTLISCIAGM